MQVSPQNRISRSDSSPVLQAPVRTWLNPAKSHSSGHTLGFHEEVHKRCLAKNVLLVQICRLFAWENAKDRVIVPSSVCQTTQIRRWKWVAIIRNTTKKTNKACLSWMRHVSSPAVLIAQQTPQVLESLSICYQERQFQTSQSLRGQRAHW